MLHGKVRPRQEAKHLLVQPGGCFAKKILVPEPILLALLRDGKLELLQTEVGEQYAWTSGASSGEQWAALLSLWPETDPAFNRVVALAEHSVLETQNREDLHGVRL